MSQDQLLAQASPPSAWHMYRSMVGVGLVCGLLIVGVFEFTRPVIARNKAAALQRAIFQVLPRASATATFRLDEAGAFEASEDAADGAARVHAGYDAERRLVGVAVEAEGMGYQDVIRVIYGYSFDEEAVVGIRVLESRETPGLGDRIESDAGFLENFRRLTVALNDDRTAIAHPIQFVRQGAKQHPWQIDGITGATISSNAIAEILSRSTEYWIPRIRPHRDDFQRED